MNDTDPLLSTAKKESVDGDYEKKLSLSGTFAHLRQCFSPRRTREQYKKLDDSTDPKNIETPVGFFQLFRLADRIDFLLLFLGICATVLHGTCVTLRFLIFGQLAGLFASQGLNQHYHNLAGNESLIVNDNLKCPLGIQLNSSNYDQFYKFCHYNNTESVMAANLSGTVFRQIIMTKLSWLMILFPVEFICSFGEHFLFSMAARRQTSRIRIRLVQSILQRRISYFDVNSMGQFSIKLFDNVEKLNRSIDFELSILLGISVSVISSITVAFIVNWLLTLILIPIIPFVIIGSYVFPKFVAKESMNELNTYSKAGQIVQEVFSSLRTVLSLNGENFEQKRYEHLLQETHYSSVRKGAAFGLFSGWIYLITYIVYAAGFIFGSILTQYEGRNQLNLSDILVIVIVFARNTTFVANVSPFLQSLAEAQGAMAPVFRFIDEAEEAHLNEADIYKDVIADREPVLMNGDIHFDKVSFAYSTRPDVPVLKDLSLIARAGEMTALVGFSGCGKSTCLSLLLRFYEPLSGQITINGQSISDFSVKQLRQKISVVNQEPILFATTILENIRYGKETATISEIEEVARRVNAHDFIMQLPNKYETLVGEHGSQLSGGEKQRIVLARAYLRQSVVMLLDEATSALDRSNERIVQDATYRACEGRTTIVIAHRLKTIEKAHRIYVLAHGRVVEEGTHETLMSKEGGSYRAMVEAQKAGKSEDDVSETKDTSEVEEKYSRDTRESLGLIDNNQVMNENKRSLISSIGQGVFLRLLRMNSPEWLIILIGCSACLLCGASTTIFAVLLSKIVNAFGNPRVAPRHRQVIIFSCFFVLLGIIILVIRFIQFTAFALAGSKLTQRVRAKAFSKLLLQEVGYFDLPENSSGAISNRLSSEASSLQQVTGIRLGIICEAIGTFGFGFLIGIILSWQLTLIIMFSVAMSFALAFMQILWQARCSKYSGSIFDKANSLVVEVVQNMRTVKQLSIEKQVLQQYSKFLHKASIVTRNYGIVSALLYGVFWSLPSLILCILYGCALFLVEHHRLEARKMLIVFVFATFTFESLRIVMSFTQHMGTSLSAARNFFNLFDRKPKICNIPTGGHQLTEFSGTIDFDQVKFAYPTRPQSLILNRFQLSIKSGQRVAIVGTSGCGKSTTIQLLERFYDVTHGRLCLSGVDVRQLNIQWLRSQIGLVSQEPILFDLTIGENIAYGQENARLEDIINAAQKANIHQFIHQLPQGYDTNVGTKGVFLSGGEKQRIAIARTLFRSPKILLLDEHTSAMDLYNEQIIQETFEQLQREDPTRTSLIITHRLQAIQACDLICVLDKGHIVESGTHADLIQQHGIYYRMFAQNMAS